MTLLAEIQSVMERTYRPTGVNLEDCLIGAARSMQLAAFASPPARDLSPLARTYLRFHDGNLYLALYYHPELIDQLETEDPRRQISHRNVGAFITFVEEITHGVHAALAFQQGWKRMHSEQFACALECQARVDTYYILLRFCQLLTGKIRPQVRSWIKEQLFDREDLAYSDAQLSRRYTFANRLARDFVELCEGVDAAERVRLIRDFNHPSLPRKCRLVRRLHLSCA